MTEEHECWTTDLVKDEKTLVDLPWKIREVAR